MPALRSDVDPEGLLEYSVVFTDRSLNHMSAAFQEVMRDLSVGLKSVYNADHVALVPGGGTYAMEAVARQFGGGEHVMVLRNGWFSYRWSQIFDTGAIPASQTVLKAIRTDAGPRAAFAPMPIKDVVAKIHAEKPALVCAPHVETSAGVILPDNYIAEMASAAQEVGALFALDCIASGCIWVDMKALGVDILISAPQKGWSASPSAGVVMMNERAAEVMEARESTSFAMNLKTWAGIMKAYENGGHAYHATMPTDALRGFRDAMKEAEAIGFDSLKAAQYELGAKMREVLEARQNISVAASGFKAPGVVVSFTDDPEMKSGKAMAARGLQIAAGVPLALDEGPEFSTYRLGLFGLDKLTDIDGTVARLVAALDA